MESLCQKIQLIFPILPIVDTAYNVMQAYITALETTCRTLNFNAILKLLIIFLIQKLLISLALAVLVQVQMNLRINL